MKYNDNETLYRGASSYEVPIENMYVNIYGGNPCKYEVEDSFDYISFMKTNPKMGVMIYENLTYVESEEKINSLIFNFKGILIHIQRVEGRSNHPYLTEETNLPDKSGCFRDDYAISFLYNAEYSNTFRDFLKLCAPFIRKKDSTRPELNLVVSDNGDFYLKAYPIKKIDINIKEDYSNEIVEKHDKIVDKLNSNHKNGILFLHGDPGTGKSYYIRNLIHCLKKKVIYLPPDMSHLISSPEFIPFLTNHPNSILLIEDGENIIGKRKNGEGNQAIANLLNLSDGLLSDALSIQLICTFNADKKEIDEALLRKGRLIDILEFKAIEVEKAQKLSDKLGFKTKITTAKTLAEIYNQDDDINTVQSPYKPIGFITGQ